MVEKVKTILGYRFPMTIMSMAWVLSLMLTALFWAQNNFYSKAEGNNLECITAQIATRQEYVLINQTVMMQKMGVTPITVPGIIMKK